MFRFSFVRPRRVRTPRLAPVHLRLTFTPLNYWRSVAACGVAAGLLACTGGPASLAIPPRLLGRDVPSYVPAATDRGRVDRPTFASPTDSIALRDAVALALLHSPELAAFAWETRAREAQVLQAGAYPNPVVGVTAEDVGASNLPLDVPRNAQNVQPQTTVQLNQLFELGGKRTARRNLAARTRDLAAWDYEAARIAVLTRVTQEFVDVLAAQEMVALATQSTDLVRQVRQNVGARVSAGVVSPIEDTRAEVALAAVRVESSRAVRLLESARRRLAANWGASEATFARGVGDLNVVSALPAFSELTTRLTESPDLARWAVEILQREAAVSVEAARRIPDVTVTSGYRRFTDLGSTAFVLGASIPLPLFDRNGGAIREAQLLAAKAHEERRAAEARVSIRLAEAYRALASTHDELTVLSTTVLPGSRQAFEAVSEGYRAGKFGFLDVLDAQRTLIAAGGQYLRALSDYHKAVADVERLIGAPLSSLSAGPR